MVRHTPKDQGKALLILLSVIVLLFIVGAVLFRFSYGYYTLLRWVVTSAAAFMAYQGFERDSGLFAWLFIIIGVLFNPILPLHLGRNLWVIVDIVAAVCWIVGLVALIRRPPA